MKKWTYEAVSAMIDAIGFAYIENKVSHEQKKVAEEAVFGASGWTWDEMMDECEKRM